MTTPVLQLLPTWPLTHALELDTFIADFGDGFEQRINFNTAGDARADGEGGLTAYKGRNRFTLKCTVKDFDGEAAYLWAFYKARVGTLEPFFLYNIPDERATADPSGADPHGRYLVRFADAKLSREKFTLRLYNYGLALVEVREAFDAPSALAMTTMPPLPDGGVGVAYSVTFVATGGTLPYVWSVVAGALPAGLTLSSGGVLSGTPTTVGTPSFTVAVTDSYFQQVTRSFTIDVAAGIVIVAADDFNRADSTAAGVLFGAGANWAWDSAPAGDTSWSTGENWHNSGQGCFQINGNQAYIGVINWWRHWGAIHWVPNQFNPATGYFVQITYKGVVNADGGRVGLMFNGDGGGHLDALWLQSQFTTQQSFAIGPADTWNYTGMVPSTYAQYNSILPMPANTIWRVECFGTTITVKIKRPTDPDFVTIMTVTRPSLRNPAYIGFFEACGSSNGESSNPTWTRYAFDDFQAGTL